MEPSAIELFNQAGMIDSTRKVGEPYMNASTSRIAHFLNNGTLAGHASRGSANLVSGFWFRKADEGSGYLPALYSYGPHYHLIRLDLQGEHVNAYLNETKNSATTGQHRSKARAALVATGFTKVQDKIDMDGFKWSYWMREGGKVNVA